MDRKKVILLILWLAMIVPIWIATFLPSQCETYTRTIINGEVVEEGYTVESGPSLFEIYGTFALLTNAFASATFSIPLVAYLAIKRFAEKYSKAAFVIATIIYVALLLFGYIIPLSIVSQADKAPMVLR